MVYKELLGTNLSYDQSQCSMLANVYNFLHKDGFFVYAHKNRIIEAVTLFFSGCKF